MSNRRDAVQPPDWLIDEAKAVFRRARRARPDADVEQLALYASAVADAQRAQDLLNRSGPLVQGAKGLARNPLQSVKSANVAAARALAKDLGLNDADLPRPRARRRRNQRAAEATIASLRQLGRIEPVDEATIAMVRSLAVALDTVEPDEPAIASIARTQLAALRLLRGQTDDSATALAALLAGVSATVGDSPNP